MQAQTPGRFRARKALAPEELEAAHALRYRAFNDRDDGCTPVGRDVDAFDAVCETYVIACTATGAIVGTFRVLPLASGREISRSYSAQFYNLDHLVVRRDRSLVLAKISASLSNGSPGIAG